MSTLMTRVEKFEDQYLAFMKRVEEPVLKFTGAVAIRAAKVVSGRPEFLDGMPTLPVIVENGLTFRKRMVDQQASFARKMVKAMDPVLAKTAPVAAETAPATTAKVAPAGVTRMPRRTTKRAAKPAAKRTSAAA